MYSAGYSDWSHTWRYVGTTLVRRGTRSHTLPFHENKSAPDMYVTYLAAPKLVAGMTVTSCIQISHHSYFTVKAFGPDKTSNTL